jgi:hypothetical protein
MSAYVSADSRGAYFRTLFAVKTTLTRNAAVTPEAGALVFFPKFRFRALRGKGICFHQIRKQRKRKIAFASRK